MKKRNLIAFCVVLVLVCNFLGVSQSGAWFVSGGNFTENRYDTAQVVYLPALQSEDGYNAGIPKYGCLLPGSTDSNNVVYLVPGDSMIAAGNYPSVLSLENFSTVPTNVQARVDVTFDNNFYDESGTITGQDAVTDKSKFSWQPSGRPNTYEYGVYSASADGTQGLFMPLIRVTFANVAAGSNTVLPAEYKDATNTSTAYQWVLTSDVTPAAWNLTLTGGENSGLNIPPISGDTKQFYNVITGFEVVAETLDQANQDEFDAFFSAHYAGREIEINVKYYAKQTAGEWNLFENQEVVVAQLALSREQASKVN